MSVRPGFHTQTAEVLTDSIRVDVASLTLITMLPRMVKTRSSLESIKESKRWLILVPLLQERNTQLQEEVNTLKLAKATISERPLYVSVDQAQIDRESLMRDDNISLQARVVTLDSLLETSKRS